MNRVRFEKKYDYKKDPFIYIYNDNVGLTISELAEVSDLIILLEEYIDEIVS